MERYFSGKYFHPGKKVIAMRKSGKKLAMILLAWNLTLSGFYGTGAPLTVRAETVETTDKAAGKEEAEGWLDKIFREQAHFLGLTKEQRLEDYDYMWKTLEESYPFLLVAERAGVDIKGIKDSYRQSILDSDSDMAFLSAVNSAIYNMGGFGHLMFFDAQTYFDYQNFYKSLEKSSSKEFNDSFKPWYDAIRNPETQISYKKTVPAEQAFVKAKLEEMERLNPGSTDNQGAGAMPEEAENLALEILELGKTAYVKINSFTMENMEEDGKRLLDFYSKIQGYENLIIDLTENGGGSDRYWMDYIVAPNIDETLESSNYLLFQENGNNKKYLASIGEEEKLPVSQLPNFENLNKDDTKGLSHFIKNTTAIEPASGKKAFGGKIWVLTSDRIYSSAESFVMFCKNTGFAALAGTSTGGDGGGVDPVYIELPNSHYLIRYSMFYGINGDGSCNEEAGTAPDIEKREKETALDACLRGIHSQN